MKYPGKFRRMLLWILTLGGLVILAGCVVANRFYVPPAFEQATLENQQSTPLGQQLRITTWNIGYAGMGRDSDFVFDLGTQRRPLRAELVDENLTAIQTHLRTTRDAVDVYLFQEAARPSWSTYRRDVLAGLTETLPDFAWFFGADVDTRFVPPPFDVHVGNAVFTNTGPASAERRGLPLEPDFQLGLFRKGYRMHILRIDDDRQWVIINIHLSTFDSAEDDVRRQQVIALLEFANEEYAKGNHVVIGGDWNLRLAPTQFPHQTDEQFQFWIRDFPMDLIPEGWQFAVDDTTPTVRTAHQPYVAGDNYTLIIDGFLVSPNVDVASVSTDDLGFEHTDHHPVTAVLEARD